MKTEGATSNVIWTSNVDLPHLGTDECLPVIGSCQVSSILSNLDTPDKIIQNVEMPSNMEVILLQNNDYKSPIIDEHLINSTNFYILKDDSNKNILNLIKSNERRKSKKSKSKENEVLFVTCDLCPYVCLSQLRISEHLENVHKNGVVLKRLQIHCPACPNVFYHKQSFQSHLTFDHNVSEEDLSAIMEIFTSSLEEKIEEVNKSNEETINLSVNRLASCKEYAINYAIINTDKVLAESNDSEPNISHDVNISENLEAESTLQVMKNLEPLVQNESDSNIVNLPTIDLSHNNAEKLFNDYIKRETKFLETKSLHKCLMCKTRMQDPDKLNYHIKCHSESCFKCPECNQLFSFWKPLTGHLWRSHKIDMELFSCDKCDYKTFSQAKLNNIHKLIHSDVKGYSCELCNKAFKNMKQLRNHKITHKEKTDNTTFFCEICTKKFFDKRQLKVHMDTVHKKIKPFLCNFCCYKGGTRSALKMHIRQHTGEKPFSCDVCDYTTADHNSLRRHKLRHSGQKPYKCSHCDYACIQSSTYKVHLKTKHPGLEKDLLFSCQECQFKSINRDIYCTHITTVHKHKVYD